MLLKERDKSRYRHKGLRQTTVKTIYGEVTYSRVIYEVIEDDGTKHFVYLLDETLELENIGLISTNMAELLVKGITEQSYRACAAQISETTGQTISAMGVYIKLQGKDRRKNGQDKAEMKIGIAYDGWKRIGKDRYELANKVIVAGFAHAKEFHEYREAAIAEIFNLD